MPTAGKRKWRVTAGVAALAFLAGLGALYAAAPWDARAVTYAIQVPDRVIELYSGSGRDFGVSVDFEVVTDDGRRLKVTHGPGVWAQRHDEGLKVIQPQGLVHGPSGMVRVDLRIRAATPSEEHTFYGSGGVVYEESFYPDIDLSPQEPIRVNADQTR
jgi:hypothetical protein